MGLLPLDLCIMIIYSNITENFIYDCSISAETEMTLLASIDIEYDRQTSLTLISGAVDSLGSQLLR